MLVGSQIYFKLCFQEVHPQYWTLIIPNWSLKFAVSLDCHDHEDPTSEDQEEYFKIKLGWLEKL